MKQLVAFGDYLIHFSPPGYQRFAQATAMEMTFTGAEANVCAALSHRGYATSFVTSLPKHALADRGIAFLRGIGVGVEAIRRCGNRMGTYYLEKGASVRSSSVIYDREHTAFCESTAADYPWDAIFCDAAFYYLTGITPMLSESLEECALVSLRKAKEKAVITVFDLNYRSRLGTPMRFREFLLKAAKDIDVLIINEEHAKMLFGLHSSFGEADAKKRLRELSLGVRDVTGVATIAMPVRRTLSASDNVIYGAFLDGDDFAVSPCYSLHLVDRVGGGDAFSAGLIEACLQGFSTEKTIGFAVASSALKHTVESDINFSSTEEALLLMQGQAGDVRR